MEAFFIIELLCLAIFACCLICFLTLSLTGIGEKKQGLQIPKSDKKTRFAIIIPARNESLVIDSNLKALHSASYPKESYDVYVIVESMEDKTVELCKNYENVTVFQRVNLKNKGKGHALDECIGHILENNDVYDAFMILDADNVVTADFLSKMSDAFQAGYEASCGNRNNKDWDSSAVSSSSGLTFTVINSIQNKSKTAHGLSVMFSGTGFYVSADVLRRLGGWKFYSLTEDYEFSTFAMCNGIKTCYIEDAVYYDEQPRTLWQSIIQRTRWVKGYFTVRIGYRKMKKEYAKKKPKNKDLKLMRLGTLPALVAVIDIIAYLIAIIVGIVVDGILDAGFIYAYLIRLGATLLTVYIIIAIFTAYLFHLEGDNIKIKRKNKIKTVFYHPIYLVTYVVAAVRTFFIKNEWEVIEHSITRKADEL